MGYLIGLILVGMFVTFITYRTYNGDAYQEDAVINSIIVCCVLIVILMILPLAGSYRSYVFMKQNAATVQQYRDSIDMYSERGMFAFQAANGFGIGGKEITDLKYQTYQQQMARMIAELREQVAEYNKDLAGKQVMKNHFMWNILIYLPEDMKPLTLE